MRKPSTKIARRRQAHQQMSVSLVPATMAQMIPEPIVGASCATWAPYMCNGKFMSYKEPLCAKLCPEEVPLGPETKPRLHLSVNPSKVSATRRKLQGRAFGH